MKYLYKQTGVVVESSIELDSAIFMPIKEGKEKAVVNVEEAPKKAAPKTAAKRTTTTKTGTQRKTTAKRTTSAKK